jgi:hypothetical protein
MRVTDTNAHNLYKNIAGLGERGRARDQQRPANDRSDIRTEKSQAARSADAPGAKLVSKSFGFSLGKFGFRYTSDEFEVDAERAARDLRTEREDQTREAFGQELREATDREDWLDKAGELSAGLRAEDPGDASEFVALEDVLRQRKGMRAYADGVLLARGHEPGMRTHLGTI